MLSFQHKKDIFEFVNSLDTDDLNVIVENTCSLIEEAVADLDEGGKYVYFALYIVMAVVSRRYKSDRLTETVLLLNCT